MDQIFEDTKIIINEDYPLLAINMPVKRDVSAMTMSCIMKVLNSNLKYNILLRLLIGKSSIDQARSMMLTAWYLSKPSAEDLFLFIDSDQVFLTSDIEKLIAIDSDVVCGVYANMADIPTCRAYNYNTILNEGQGEIRYGATGFMLIRTQILSKLVSTLTAKYGREGHIISSGLPRIIPFFIQTLQTQYYDNLEIEIDEWLGEDYSFCNLVRQVGGTIKAYMSPSLGHMVQSCKFIPQPQFRARMSDQSIVYFCPSNMFWEPNSKNLGGSEQAVVALSEQWAKAGYQVLVYANSPKINHHNVQYLPFNELNPYICYNILICWRSGGLVGLNQLRANKILVDFHDEIGESTFDPARFSLYINQYMVKSNYHKQTLCAKIEPLLHNLVKVIPNGVRDIFLNTKIDNSERDKNRIIYASSYTRGLQILADDIMPLIQKEIPNVRLDVYYGRDLLSPDEHQTANRIFKKPNIFEHPRLNYQELFQERLKSRVHCYPLCLAEVDCLSVKESILAGCVPVVSENKVFSDADRDYVVKIPRYSTQITTLNEISIKTMADEVIKLMSDDDYFSKTQTELHSRAKFDSWSQTATKWLQIMK